MAIANLIYYYVYAIEVKFYISDNVGMVCQHLIGDDISTSISSQFGCLIPIVKMLYKRDNVVTMPDESELFIL